MKLICIPHQSLHFYLKPDTALLRSGQTFYAPDFCAMMSGALALVIKINRLGRHISPRFAYRYYNSTTLGFCLYAANLLEKCRVEGTPWAPACALDYSAPLSDLFCPLSESDPQRETFTWELWSGAFTGSIDQAIAHISRFIFLKMGDLIWLELHPPLPLSAPCEVHALRNGMEQLCFSVR